MAAEVRALKGHTPSLLPPAAALGTRPLDAGEPASAPTDLQGFARFVGATRGMSAQEGAYAPLAAANTERTQLQAGQVLASLRAARSSAPLNPSWPLWFWSQIDSL